jgi:hypothetical protein
VTTAATAAARGADTPMIHAALDALARLPVDNDKNNNFANVSGGGGGGGGGPGTGSGMIIDLQSVHAAIKKEDIRRTVLRRGRKWNGLILSN